MLHFAVFLFAYTMSQFFRAFLAVIAPGLALELELSPSDLANMSAAWFGVFAFAQFPLGVALDRLGPRRTVPALMLAGVAGALLLSQARSTTGCIVAMALIGLGCSPIYMGALYYYGRTESPARFGFFTATLLGIGSMGNLLASTPLAFSIQTFGWRPTLVGLGFTMLASAMLFLALVRDPPIAEKPKAKASAMAELVQIATLPGFWKLMPLLSLGYAAVVVERGLWVGPYFAEVHKLAPIPLGNAALAMAVAMSMGALAFGWADRTHGNRKQLVVVGTVLTAVGFGLLAVRPQLPLGLAVAAIAWIGFMGLCQPMLFAHARMFFPEHLLGRGITFANFLTIGGAGIVQFGSGAFVSRLKSAGLSDPDVYASLHMLFTGITLVALIVYLFAPIPAAPKRAG